jgi:hypothetical protein
VLGVCSGDTEAKAAAFFLISYKKARAFYKSTVFLSPRAVPCGNFTGFIMKSALRQDNTNFQDHPAPTIVPRILNKKLSHLTCPLDTSTQTPTSPVGRIISYDLYQANHPSRKQILQAYPRSKASSEKSLTCYI